MEENENNELPTEENPTPPPSAEPFERKDPRLQPLHEGVDKIQNELQKVIVGQGRMVQLLIVALLSDGHVLIEGVPGVAKTLTAKLLARTFNLEFRRIQFTPDLMPSDVIGTSIFNAKTQDFEFRRGPIFSNILLIDEINRAPAKTQAALFEVMEERQVTVDGQTYRLAPPFVVLATQNPVEQEGTYNLPEAQLDRFLFKINVEYPSLDEEIQILQGFQSQRLAEQIEQVQAVVDAASLATFRKLVHETKVEDNILRYIAGIVNQTRNNQSLYLGASPRASLAILSGSKALACMRGRSFVIPEDVQAVAPYVLQHRVLLTPEKEMEGFTTEAVVKDMVKRLEVPR